MLDNLSYGARISLHQEALIELFKQIKENRNIHIKDIVIQKTDEADWKDFLMQTIQLGGGAEEIWGNEDRPFSNDELRFLLLEDKFNDLFISEIKKAGVLPDFLTK